MSHISRFRLFYLSHLSKPHSDRLVYRTIRRDRVRSILELGMGIGQRAVRMIEVAAASTPPGEVRYTGIDAFESRTSQDGPGVSLRMAHRLLAKTGACVQLVPGDPGAALARVANRLGQVDLVVVSSRLDPTRMASAWFYLLRLLHNRSHVLQEATLAGGRPTIRRVSADELQTLAAGATGRRAA